MKPVTFPEHNAVLAKDQPQYDPLPVHRTKDGIVVSCWRLSFWQRVKLLITGRVWVMCLTFGDPLQPLNLATKSPFVAAK